MFHTYLRFFKHLCEPCQISFCHSPVIELLCLHFRVAGLTHTRTRFKLSRTNITSPHRLLCARPLPFLLLLQVVECTLQMFQLSLQCVSSAALGLNLSYQDLEKNRTYEQERCNFTLFISPDFQERPQFVLSAHSAARLHPSPFLQKPPPAACSDCPDLTAANKGVSVTYKCCACVACQAAYLIEALLCSSSSLLEVCYALAVHFTLTECRLCTCPLRVCQ